MDTVRTLSSSSSSSNTPSRRAEDADPPLLPEDEEVPSGPCLGKLTCEECKNASSELKDGSNEFCLWNDSSCEVALTTEHDPAENVCGGGGDGDASDSAKNDSAKLAKDCQSAKTCDECDQKEGVGDGKVCSWNEGVCTEATKKDKDMCTKQPNDDAPTKKDKNKKTEDPCDGAVSCQSCRDASKTIKADEKAEQICFWSATNTCAKGPKTVHPEAGDSMCSCEEAKTCQGCWEAAKAFTGGASCHWNTTAAVCSISITTTTSPDFTCDDASGGTALPIDSGVSSEMIYVVVAAFVAMTCCWLYRRRRSTGMHVGELSGAKRFHTSGVYDGVATSETDNHNDRRESYSGNNDTDDWGWDEEDGGDLELAGGQNDGGSAPGSNPFSARGLSSYHDQTKESKTPPSQKKKLVRRSGSNNKEEGIVPLSNGRPFATAVKTTSSGSSSEGSSLLQQRQQQQQQAQQSAPPPPPAPLRITKLGSPKLPAEQKKPSQIPPPKKSEDDFFAEMGLAAKPTFNTTTNKSSATHIATLGATHLPADDFSDAGWNDDADLDDLLDD